MYQFEYPYMLFMLPLPLVVYFLLPEFKQSGIAVRAPFIYRIARLKNTSLRHADEVIEKTLLQKFIFCACWILILLAIARPVEILPPITKETAGRDLLLIIDLSGSMQTEDFGDKGEEKLSRLTAVKNVIRQFIEKRSSDRIGVSVFGTAAFPLVPFTKDHDVIISLLQDLKPAMAGPKTMIGDAIGVAIKMFEKSDNEDKLAILLTDGNDTNSKMPVLQAAEIAKQNNIILHTIAIGDPVTTGEAPLNEGLLKAIAGKTGGKYYLALNQQELRNVYDELDQLAPDKIETKIHHPKRQLFYYPLTAILVLAGGFLFFSGLRNQHAPRGQDDD